MARDSSSAHPTGRAARIADARLPGRLATARADARTVRSLWEFERFELQFKRGGRNSNITTG